MPCASSAPGIVSREDWNVIDENFPWLALGLVPQGTDTCTSNVSEVSVAVVSEKSVFEFALKAALKLRSKL